jgi:hypothetical protein
MPMLDVRLLGTLDWTEDLPGESSPAGPNPGVGGLIVSGFTPPARPHLQISTSAAGTVGVVTGPGADRRTVVRFLPSGAEQIRLPERALAAVDRTDGLWVLTADSLSVVDAAGRVAAAAKLPADRILGTLTTNDTIWALEPDAASFVSPDGSFDRFATPRSHPTGVVAFGDSIVGLDLDQPGHLVELRHDGSRNRRPATFQTEPLERLLAYDGATALLNVLTRLRRVGGDVDDVLDVVGCGCSDEGVYVAVRTSTGAWLITSYAAPEPLQLATDEHVLAAALGRALVSSRTSARWIATGDEPQTADEPISLNESSYARQVQPHAWQMPSGFAIQAGSPTEILLTASGPAGAVVLTATWSMS